MRRRIRRRQVTVPAAHARQQLCVFPAAASAPAVAVAPVPAPTAASFSTVSTQLRARPPRVQPRSVAPIKDAASVVAAAPALCFASLHAMAGRRPPNSE